MRRQYLRIVIAVIGFAGLGVIAKAQAVDQVVVNIPFEFMVAGKTLPAGTYAVKRLSDTDPSALILSSFENRANAIVVSTQVESSSDDKAKLTFEQVGDEHFLSKIETADHVFTMMPASHSEILEAAAKSHSATPVSGSASGSN
jgi:hypothetical protein